MKKITKTLGFLSISCILVSILCSVAGNYIMDYGKRESIRYIVPIPESTEGNLVYYEWEPLPTAPDREDKVVFLFAGFLAQQTMMYPMMQEFTKKGYHVITGDFRGHGESDGEFSMNWNVLLDDFLAIFDAVKNRHEDWNFTHVSVCGHSMGGFAALLIGNQVDAVWNTVAFAPATYAGNVNSTNPKNMLIVLGGQDQAFSVESTLSVFQRAVPEAITGKLYGDPLEGNAKKMVVAPWARHENELIDDYCLGQAISFVEMGYGYMNPGDDYLADQESRLEVIEIGLILGMLGICGLFFTINQLELKKPENEILKKLYNTFIGDYFSPEDQKQLDDDLRPISKQAAVAQNFIKDWIVAYLPGTIAAAIMFGLSLFVIKDIFSNLQILILGIPGFTSLFLAIRNYKRERTNYQSFGQYISPLHHQFKREFSFTAITIGILMYGVSLFIILFGFGQAYMFLFPMNQRALNLIILIPLIFIMYLILTWSYIYHLVDRLRDQGSKGFWKAVGIVLLTKPLGIYLISIIFLLLGNMFITILLMLSIIDILATLLLVVNYWFKKSYGAIMVWATLLISSTYLGYAGVINGWEIFFGTEYNAFYWIG